MLTSVVKYLKLIHPSKQQYYFEMIKWFFHVLDIVDCLLTQGIIDQSYFCAILRINYENVSICLNTSNYMFIKCLHYIAPTHIDDCQFDCYFANDNYQVDMNY